MSFRKAVPNCFGPTENGRAHVCAGFFRSHCPSPPNAQITPFDNCRMPIAEWLTFGGIVHTLRVNGAWTMCELCAIHLGRLRSVQAIRTDEPRIDHFATSLGGDHKLSISRAASLRGFVLCAVISVVRAGSFIVSRLQFVYLIPFCFGAQIKLKCAPTSRVCVPRVLY